MTAYASTRLLYIPFWLNLYAAVLVYYAIRKGSLHSILVKSILPKRTHVSTCFPALHSILVKSIPVADTLRGEIVSLYIPFWLNLYHVTAIYYVVGIVLYIPFWLNLYLWNLDGIFSVGPLHSILVKSILYTFPHIIEPNELYIPFWLNLYFSKFSRIDWSIGLYIPFWLNLYILCKLHKQNRTSFTFHSG